MNAAMVPNFNDTMVKQIEFMRLCTEMNGHMFAMYYQFWMLPAINFYSGYTKSDSK